MIEFLVVLWRVIVTTITCSTPATFQTENIFPVPNVELLFLLTVLRLTAFAFLTKEPFQHCSFASSMLNATNQLILFRKSSCCRNEWGHLWKGSPAIRCMLRVEVWCLLQVQNYTVLLIHILLWVTSMGIYPAGWKYIQNLIQPPDLDRSNLRN